MLPVRASQSGDNGAVLQQHLHGPRPALPGREMQRRRAVVVPDVDKPGVTPAMLPQQQVSDMSRRQPDSDKFQMRKQRSHQESATGVVCAAERMALMQSTWPK